MKRISHKRTNELIAEMKHAGEYGPQTWHTWANTQGDHSAIVEFPCGELMNTHIVGYVWAWNAKRIIQTLSIEKQDRFNAQGIEGKVAIRTTLTTALMVYRDLPAYRCQVKVSA